MKFSGLVLFPSRACLSISLFVSLPLWWESSFLQMCTLCFDRCPDKTWTGHAPSAKTINAKPWLKSGNTVIDVIAWPCFDERTTVYFTSIVWAKAFELYKGHDFDRILSPIWAMASKQNPVNSSSVVPADGPTVLPSGCPINELHSTLQPGVCSKLVIGLMQFPLRSDLKGVMSYMEDISCRFWAPAARYRG